MANYVDRRFRLPVILICEAIDPMSFLPSTSILPRPIRSLMGILGRNADGDREELLPDKLATTLELPPRVRFGALARAPLLFLVQPCFSPLFQSSEFSIQ